MIFVMIAGASASGKTAFSQRLLERLQQDSRSCQMISMDNYYKERDVLKYPDIDLFRQDPQVYAPTHLCLQQLCDDLTALAQGQSIYQKTLIFATNRYQRDASGELILEKIDPSDIIIMEGVFAQHFADAYLPAEYPRVSVNVASSSYLNIIKARLERDTAPLPIGRALTRQQVRANERQFVGPVFFQYTAKHATGSDVYILNDHSNDNLEGGLFEEGIEAVVDKINEIQQALESTPYLPKKNPLDARQMAKASHAMLHAQRAPKRHHQHDIIEAMQKRSKIVGPFFKSPVMEDDLPPQPDQGKSIQNDTII